MRDVQQEQAVNLRQDLLITEACAADGARRATCHASAATLAESQVDFRHYFVFMEENGIEWAQIVANAAARTLILVNRGAYRFECNFLLLNLAQDTRCCSCTLHHTGRDIFRTLRAASERKSTSIAGCGWLTVGKQDMIIIEPVLKDLLGYMYFPVM